MGAATTLLVLPRLSRERQAARIQAWCSKLLRILNVTIREYGRVPADKFQRTLFVSNHISWLDIWVLKHLHHLHFVAKSDIRGWPVIGWLATQTGTLFIERERRSDTRRALQEIEQALSLDENLCFFPEGTTTDGTRLLPFKPSLFQAALNTHARIQPLAIRYVHPDDTINTVIAYCDDITLWQSLNSVLSQQEIVVELYYAAPVSTMDVVDRRALSQHARQSIASLLHPKAHRAPETPAYPQDASH